MNFPDPLASIRRFFDAENAYFAAGEREGDIASLLQFVDPEVVIEVPDSLPHGGTWRGHAGFVDLFAEVAVHWSEFQVVSDASNWSVFDDGRVLAEGALQAVLRGTGHPVDMRVASLFSFSRCGVSRLVHYYWDTAVIA